MCFLRHLDSKVNHSTMSPKPNKKTKYTNISAIAGVTE